MSFTLATDVVGRVLSADFVVRVRNGQHLAAVCQSIERLLGAAIIGVQQPAPPPSGHIELELVRQSLTNPERALQTLVDGLPGVLGADWAAVVERGPDKTEPLVVIASMRYSGHDHLQLADAARFSSINVVRLGGPEPYGTAALAPIGSTGQCFLVAREHGLQFHRSELDRLGEIGSIAAHVVSTLAAAA